jgi:hypothetical protein
LGFEVKFIGRGTEEGKWELMGWAVRQVHFLLMKTHFSLYTLWQSL